MVLLHQLLNAFEEFKQNIKNHVTKDDAPLIELTRTEFLHYQLHDNCNEYVKFVYSHRLPVLKENNLQFDFHTKYMTFACGDIRVVSEGGCPHDFVHNKSLKFCFKIMEEEVNNITEAEDLCDQRHSQPAGR